MGGPGGDTHRVPTGRTPPARAPRATSTPAPPTVLCVAGSDSAGGAGLAADLKTLLACHVHGLVAVTAVTVQESTGVHRSYELPPAAVAEQIDAVAGDMGVDAVKTGMLASTGIVEAVAEALGRNGLRPVVVDPVAASRHGDPLLTAEARTALVRLLLPLTTVLTPNLDEARLLTGIDVHSPADQRDVARRLHALGPDWVLLKGGHLPGDVALDLLYDGSSFVELAEARIPTRHAHGTGDTLASAVAAGLARGLDVPTAVRAAKRFVTEAVRHSYPLGRGDGPVGHFWAVRDRR